MIVNSYASCTPCFGAPGEFRAASQVLAVAVRPRASDLQNAGCQQPALQVHA